MNDKDRSISGMKTVNPEQSLGELPTMQLDQKGIGLVDRYELLEKLGEGGFGAVYGARDTEAGILVALKALPAEVSCDVEEMASIRDNFALVSRLSHPNIAGVKHLHRVDFADARAQTALGVRKNDYLVVMEYAPGATLFAVRRSLPNQKMQFFPALEICRQIAFALDYAHSQRVLHRDIKPKNVMIASQSVESQRSEGRKSGASEASVPSVVKVLDFGLAAEIRSSMSRKSKEPQNSKSGTPLYMAPEQWKGTVQNAATDQYALAALFYELVGGTVPFKPAFDSGNFEIMRSAVCNEPVPLLSELDKKQNAVLQRALAKEPQERFECCTEFIEALAGGKIHSPRKIAKNEKTQTANGRKLTRMVGVGAIAVLVIAAAIFGVRWKAQRDTALAEQARMAQMNQAKQQQLSGLLREAETLFAGNNLDGASRKANEALALDVANNSARDLLTKIQSKVGEQQASTAKVDAKLARERVASVPDCKVKQEMERQWQIGETAWGRERWQDAWKAYQETIRLAGIVQQMPEYFAVKAKWEVKGQKSGVSEEDLNKFASAEWGQALALANQAEGLEDNPSLGKEKYLAALAKYGEAMKTTEPFLVPQLKVTVIPLDAVISVGRLPSGGAPGEGTGPTVLEKGKTYTLSVSKKGYTTFTETLVADWKGLKEITVTLEKWNGLEDGQKCTVDLGSGVSMEFMPVAAGSFMMGSGSGSSDEKPVHPVTLLKPFWMAKTEVTQAQYEQVMRSDPSNIKGSQNPVEMVRWQDAMEFCRKLTAQEQRAGRLPEGWEYTLPTEAQWEYACRAGTTGDYAGNLDSMAWYSSNSGGQTHPVGTKQPNAWGLYDMHGNVLEWCDDRYGEYSSRSATDPRGTSSDTYRVNRGGSFYSPGLNCRSASRLGSLPERTYSGLGFRPVVLQR